MYMSSIYKNSIVVLKIINDWYLVNLMLQPCFKFYSSEDYKGGLEDQRNLATNNNVYEMLIN